jgi:hypothetical protein
MEDIVKKMREISCFHFSTMREDVAGSMQEIPIIFLQEYGHRFGEDIHLILPSGQSLLVHLKVIEITCSKVFFLQGWQDVIHVARLERGDHIIITLKAHLKFHMYVFDGMRGGKKENKAWGQKHIQQNANSREENNIVSGL